jgi:hypothetical protein
VSRRAGAFFSPRLDPVLHRGGGDKEAVVAPQVPTRWAGGQAVLNHEPHRPSDHAVGIRTARGRQIGEVGTKVLATLRTVMLGIGHQQIPRTPEVEIAHIMERPMRLLVPIGRVPTTWARLPGVVATVGDDLGLGQVCGCGDPGAGVGAVLTWTAHRVALLAQRFGPELYDNRLRGATRCSRYSLWNLRFFSEVQSRRGFSMDTPQENYDMDNMDDFQERLDALEQRTEQLHQQTRTVERRLRWWRGFACGMVILGLRSWGLQASHAVLAAQVETIQNDIATLQAILWHLTTASHVQGDPDEGPPGAHRRIVPSASGGSNRTALATDHGAAGALFADN